LYCKKQYNKNLNIDAVGLSTENYISLIKYKATLFMVAFFNLNLLI